MVSCVVTRYEGNLLAEGQEEVVTAHVHGKDSVTALFWVPALQVIMCETSTILI